MNSLRTSISSSHSGELGVIHSDLEFPSGSSAGGAGGVTGFAGFCGASVDFGGSGAFAPLQLEHPVADGFFAGAVFPATRYLRIFSSRCGPMPRIALRSSTLLNAPYALRICRIFSAVTGPIPGTCCNSSDVAVFKLIGAAGGFFLACRPGEMAHSARKTSENRAISRHAIAA